MVRMADRAETSATNFNAIRISIASPQQILNWSHGEVTKPETINYRTLRPEKDGLFCERLFGPTKDWECFCGKYKRIRYRGVICDRCGVEVTRSKVRRERMGHIRLAAPVAHIWFSKTTPSRLGLLLDLSPRNLERVLYFAQHIVVSVDEALRQESIEAEKVRHELAVEKLQRQGEERLAELNARLEAADLALDDAPEVTADGSPTGSEESHEAQAANGADTAEAAEGAVDIAAIQAEIDAAKAQMVTEQGQLDEHLKTSVDELEDLRVHKLIAESRYRELKERYGDVFTAGMGAEAVLAILQTVDLGALRNQLITEMQSTSGQRRKKAIKRLRVVESFRNSGNRVEDMILTIMPVLPPELRPMVQLDGGRFATSDLNDLYRRVINRNNRLKRLMSLGAPEIIIRNEKRMLQEAVDALIDNGRRGRPIQGSHNHKLKSLSDLLRGKQGRFRQNLLGKRVDYSGRSVIVVGPELKMHECGLPRRMALELFKPFVMHRLVILGIAPNIKNAKRMVERARGEVWDILEDVIKDRPVLLNRAPTLHRLGIQAFMPVLIEGNAIQIHPLVCSAFNADFDGDQMAVHVPLSRMAVLEAREAMLSTHNMLSPASGDPLVAPTLDMVMGCYYLTEVRENSPGAGRRFNDIDEARIAHATKNPNAPMSDPDAPLLDLHAPISVRYVRDADSEWLETTLGRLIFNEIIPERIGFQNKLMDRDALKDLTADLYRTLSNDETATVLDGIKDLGFHYATTSGITIAINDIQVPGKKQEFLDVATERVRVLQEQYDMGEISPDEFYNLKVDAWTEATDAWTDPEYGPDQDIPKADRKSHAQIDMDKFGGIAIMAKSGAKGNITQIKQMAYMRGLMSNPKGRIIDIPIKSSFREGLTALEYFISTHGARKGLADTALRTADSGYLTRRLIDIAQEVIILERDCGTLDAYMVPWRPNDTDGKTLSERIKGRLAAEQVAHPQTGEILVDRNQEIDDTIARAIYEAGILEMPVRSPLICEAQRGVCQACYGCLPATGKTVQEGQAVGIIAAQSIGEPGTQLTMRTFHTGGVAGLDITLVTSGLPRVEELFEARVPKGAALLADIDGIVELEADEEGRRLRLVSREEFREDYALPEGAQVLVDHGESVEPGMVLATAQRALPAEISAEISGDPDEDAEASEEAIVPVERIEQIVANVGGRVEVSPNYISVVWEDVEVRENIIPASSNLLVRHGAEVRAGAPLTGGPLNPHDILHIRGKDELQGYLVNEVQSVYQSQGVGIHDKHIEIILRQMLRRVQVESTGGSELIPGQMVDKFNFQHQNEAVQANGGEPATAKPILLGVTRASLLTDSFLSAASFQETTRVLTQAAVSGAQDWLLGLKENVIIGRLIPARIDIPGMAELLKPRPPALDMAAIAPAAWLRAAPQGGAGPFEGGPAGEAPIDPSIFALGSGDEIGEQLTPFGEHASPARPYAPEGSKDEEFIDTEVSIEAAGAAVLSQSADAAPEADATANGPGLGNGANGLVTASESDPAVEEAADEGAE